MKTFGVVIASMLLCMRQVTPLPRHDSPHHHKGVARLPSNLSATRQHRDLDNGRLPPNLAPSHYNIELRPDIYHGGPPFPFDGSVEIFFTCRDATDQIVINSVGLEIEDGSVEFVPDEGTPSAPGIISYELDPERDFLFIYLDGNMQVGDNFILRMRFAGTLNTASVGAGVFWDSYHQDGETHYVVLSQMQATDARRAFPCFDEPAMKATFDLTMLRSAGMTALGNGHLVHSEDRDDFWVADSFATTPYMSAYLVAFAVIDYPHVETVSENGHLIRVWAREELMPAAEYALSVAGSIMDWLEDYTGQEYPMAKIDHVASPGFSGAMENWGLVHYMEPYLLYDEDWSPTSQKINVASVIAHEVGHMWFGNLVTCEWWDETWLNEGFASFMDFLALEPLDWPVSESGLYEQVFPQWEDDEYNNTMTLRPEIKTPWEAWDAFTWTAYNKGSSMVRMMQQILGPDTLKRAIQRYMDINKYSTVVTDDLWEAFTAQAAADNITDVGGEPLDMASKMNSWINQIGYPLLSVKRNNLAKTVTFTQEKYNPFDQDQPSSPYNYLWNVPITMATENDPEAPMHTDIWINQELTVDAPLDLEDDQWVLVNPKTTGFKRVFYEQENMDHLLRQLLVDHHVIDAESRATLVENAFAFARVGLVKEVDAMDTTVYLSGERDALPWLSADYGMEKKITTLLKRFPETYELMQAYLLQLVTPLYEYKGWVKEGDEDVYQMMLREVAVATACTHNNIDCVLTAQSLVEEWLSSESNPIFVDLRSAAYCTAVRTGGQAEWDAVFDKYLETGPLHLPNATIERGFILSALSCSSDEAVLSSYFELMSDDALIPANEVRSALLSLARSDQGRWFLWDYFVSFWDVNELPQGVDRRSVLMAVVDGFATAEDLASFNAFTLKFPAEDEAEEALYQSASDVIQKNLQWSENNQQQLHDWLLEKTRI